jgi:hypothetical protein
MTDKNLGHATAYGYAKSKGYTGTEEEFAELMASYAEVAESAKGYAEQAEASATNAETSETNARTSAQTASAKASEASASASNAQTSASNAQASATSAGTSASSASASAQTASTKASEASDSATSASESASTAVSAKDDAVTAKEEAETAKADAETAAEEAQESAQTVANKADKDGTYPDMTVGGVMSSDGSTDSTPYLYRASGGGVEVGKIEADKIVGGTVAFNQLSKVGTSAYSANTGTKACDSATRTFTVTNSTTVPWLGVYSLTANILSTANHKYLISVKATNSLSTKLKFGTDDSYKEQSGFTADTEKECATVIAPSARNSFIFYFSNASSVKFRDIQIIDLTQMFGSTVADYIYSLEQSSTGAGVAFFRKLFPKDYYEYNTGELISVEGLQSHDMVGVNQWDEEWELGIYNISNGEKVSNTNAIRCKNPIPVLPNTSYFKHVGGEDACTYGCYYDEDGNFISRHNAQKNTIFVTPKNCYYMTFYCESSYGTTYNHDICINISSDRNGEYEPYIKHSYPLDSSLTLRGIPKVADGKMYFDGDTYEADGTVTRKYGVVDLGTLGWVFDSTNNAFQTSSALVKIGSEGTPIICDRYVARPYGYNAAYSTEDKIIYVHAGSWKLRVRDSSYTDAATFKSAMSGVMLVYELATPTTESAEPYESIQKVSKYGTEEYVSTSIVPVGHVTKYPTDIVAKVNGLPSDFSTLIAPTESGFKATRAYSVNQFIIVNNQLYRVTSAIANGATITVGTNVVATTVADILTALLNA